MTELFHSIVQAAKKVIQMLQQLLEDMYGRIHHAELDKVVEATVQDIVPHLLHIRIHTTKMFVSVVKRSKQLNPRN